MVVLTSSAYLALPDIRILLTWAASAHSLAFLASRPAPDAPFLAMHRDITWHTSIGDLELWVSPGAYVQGLRV